MTSTRTAFAQTRRWAASSDIVRGWRERRYLLFLELCGVHEADRILDVGAGRGAALERFNSTNPILAIDLVPKQSAELDKPNVDVVQGDGTELPFRDGEFDVVFSNSVIEHVPKRLQHRFASEVRRVGARYFVQTPYRYFPIEPHYQLPLFQFLPKRVQRTLNGRFTLGWQEKGQWEEITLLSVKEFKQLFPDAEIHRERVFGVTKSLMAVRRAVPEPS